MCAVRGGADPRGQPNCNRGGMVCLSRTSMPRDASDSRRTYGIRRDVLDELFRRDPPPCASAHERGRHRCTVGLRCNPNASHGAMDLLKEFQQIHIPLLLWFAGSWRDASRGARARRLSQPGRAHDTLTGWAEYFERQFSLRRTRIGNALLGLGPVEIGPQTWMPRWRPRFVRWARAPFFASNIEWIGRSTVYRPERLSDHLQLQP